VSSGLLLGIDEGTSAVKAALFDRDLRLIAQARRDVPSSHPRLGWVEQDPELILAAVIDAVAEVLAETDGRPLLAAGLDHQGESVLAWDADSGRALTPVIGWQDKRQEQLLAALDAGALARSGLPLDPYFSAGKLAWLLANDPAVDAARAGGTLRLGTVDAFLSDRLGGRFATDLSTASRTQLLAVGGRDWDEPLLAAFGLQRAWLPPLGPSYGALGELRHRRWPVSLPLCAQLVDQQAALAGAGAVSPGQLKATYGTGVFVLGRTAEPLAAAGGLGAGRAPSDGAPDASDPPGASGLLPTVAWASPGAGGAIGDVAHALDGGVFSAGSLLEWLAHDLGLAADAPALATSAATVSDSAGVRVLPALAGVGAPWWLADARGVIAGLHPRVRPAHIARAALEAIAWRTADVVEAFAELQPVELLRVDGGLTNDPTLLQVQADALGLPLSVGASDATVLGAAMLAGVGAGVFDGIHDAAARLARGRIVSPRVDSTRRTGERARWRAFVEASSAL
jgi:glycerol kinase